MKQRVISWLIVSLLTLLSACGGGGSSPNSPNSPNMASAPVVVQTSQGSPMVYASIVAFGADSSISHGTADANGNWTLPSTGITYPVVAKAISVDGSRVYYGYAANNTQSVVPVNPLTSLIITLAYNGNPASITSSSQLSPGALSAEEGNAKAIFANIFTQFGISPSVEVLSTAVAPDHSGMDLLFDTMSIQFDRSGNPIICSKISNTCRVLNLASLDTTPIQLSVQDVTTLNQVPFSQCSALVNGLTLTAFTTDPSIYSTSFLNNGANRSQFMSFASGPYTGSNVSFNTPMYAGTDSNGNHLFQFYVSDVSTQTYRGSITLPANLQNGKCAFMGNQLPFDLYVKSTVWNQIRVDGTSQAVTNGPVIGLYFQAFSLSGTPTYAGQPVSSVSFYFCDASNNCSAPPVNMFVGSSGYEAGAFYLAQHAVPILSYSSVGITSAAQFYSGNPNPVKVVMRDASLNPIGNPLYLKIVGGGYISDNTLLDPANLPAFTNAAVILSTTTDLTNHTLTYTLPPGFVASMLLQGDQVPTGYEYGIGGQPLMSTTSGSVTLTNTIHASDQYRNLQLDSYTSGGLIVVTTRYVYDPSDPLAP
jgi:hypothetical protein